MVSLRREAVAKKLDDPETYALVLAVILEDTFGVAVLYGDDELDPLTIYTHLEETYRVRLSESVCNRIQAVLTLNGTSAFENSPEGFTAVTLALTEGHLGDMVAGIMEEVDLDAMLWAVFEASCIDPVMGPLAEPVSRLILEAANDIGDVEEAPEGSEEDPEPVAEEMAHLARQLAEVGVPARNIDQMLNRGREALTLLQSELAT